MIRVFAQFILTGLMVFIYVITCVVAFKYFKSAETLPFSSFILSVFWPFVFMFVALMKTIGWIFGLILPISEWVYQFLFK